MEQRNFYSRSKGLFICANHGQVKEVDGQTKRVNEKHIQFHQIGDLGMFSTNDPELVEFLEKREADAVANGAEPDVFGPEKYQKIIVPPEMCADSLERELQDANRLIAQLKQQGRGGKPAN